MSKPDGLNQEELKVETAEVVKTKESTFAPLEVEEGRAGEGPTAPKESKLAPVLAFVKRYRCPLATVLILAILVAILLPILWYKEITAEYDGTTKLTLRSSKINLDLAIKINNPNVYPVTFSNLELDLYDFQNIHIGRVVKSDRTKLPAKRTTMVPMRAELSPSLLEIAAIGVDCIANDNHTKVRFKGSVKVNALGARFPVKVPSDTETTMCLVLESKQPGGINVAPGITIPPFNVGPIHVGGNGVTVQPPAN